MSELAEFMVHPVSVRTRTGAGGMGVSYATPVQLTVFVDEKRRLVRSTDGAQVVSEATIYDDDLTHESAFALGSEVTLPSGRKATVLTCKRAELDELELPSHLEVTLT